MIWLWSPCWHTQISSLPPCRLIPWPSTGDISQATSSTPELVSFSNITSPTAGVQPPLGKNLLWRLLGHLSL
ncbi:MAG: hypothetical protein D3908_16030, partial [Candidatus Electrothrix sp. AUS4]|nr:hypothetical protein [Candidatus Electrothrix sp. AUS4]